MPSPAPAPKQATVLPLLPLPSFSTITLKRVPHSSVRIGCQQREGHCAEGLEAPGVSRPRHLGPVGAGRLGGRHQWQGRRTGV